MSGSVPHKLASLERKIAQISKGQRISHGASIENAAIEVKDDSGSLRTIVGLQGDGTTGVQNVNGPPPPQPSAPIVASVLGGVTVSWNGLFAGGAVIPMDWSRVEVHASLAPVYEPIPETLRTTIETAQGATVVVSCDAPVYVRLLARNLSGTASVASVTVGPFGPSPVVANDILDGIVTTVKLADDAVTKAKVAVGAIGADELALGIGNLAPDPSFEGALTAAVIAGRPDWSQATPGNNSATALHVDCTAGSTSWKNIELARYPVLPGERHYLAIDFKTSIAFNGTGAKLMFRYEDATATVLGYGVADIVFTPGAGWARATAQVQAPVGTVTAVLLVEASACSAGEVWFDNAEVRTLIAGGMVAAGAITANEIAALTIQAGNLAADSVAAGKVAADVITGREIQALSVTAAELAANAVTAGKIQAGAVTTNALTVGIAQSIAQKITDAMGDASLWAQPVDTGTWGVVSGVADAAAGGTVIEAVGKTSIERITNTPLDPDALYKVSARIRTTVAPTSGTPTVYVGLTGIAADGTTRVNVTGANSTSSQHYVAAANQTIAVGTAWTTVTGYVKGTAATGTGSAALDPKAPGQMHANVRYVRPFLRLLFGSTAGGTQQVDQVTLETVPTGVVNSVNIANGAVTANSLAADAITGKTITGGTITGSVLQTATTGQRITINEASANKVIVYDSTGTAVGELSAVGVLSKGSTGAVMVMDPNALYPSLRMTNAAGSNQAILNVVENTPGSANPGLNSGTFTGSGFTDMKWRLFLGEDFGVIERIRDSANSTIVGGRVALTGTSASVGYWDNTGGTATADMAFTPGVGKVRGRFNVQPNVGDSNSVVLIQSAAGHTGYLMRLYDTANSAYRFSVDLQGNTTVGGVLSAGNMATGSVNITPSAANTPTSASVTFPTLAGTTFRGFATAATTAPGTRVNAVPTPGAGVTGVSMSSVTNNSALVWVNRENTTVTTVNWQVIGV